LSYLLDTNVVSELRKGARANPGVARWFDAVAEEDLHLSVLVVGEIRLGVEGVRRRDAITAARLERWLSELTSAYQGRILPVDLRAAELWGRLNIPDPLPAVDGLLAATALVHDLTLVTRNTRHLGRTGVRCLNPFGAKGKG
jgi:predicted nucleic acid-binding protein